MVGSLFTEKFSTRICWPKNYFNLMKEFVKGEANFNLS